MTITYDVISADSHVVEPHDLWQIYTIERFRDRGPRLVREETTDRLVCEGARLPPIGLLAGCMRAHDEVRAKIAADNGRVAMLAREDKLDNQQRLEELFLAALGRLPNAEEAKAGVEHLETSENLRKGLEEVLWSLVNTREFQLNY